MQDHLKLSKSDGQLRIEEMFWESFLVPGIG